MPRRSASSASAWQNASRNHINAPPPVSISPAITHLSGSIWLKTQKGFSGSLVNTLLETPTQVAVPMHRWALPGALAPDPDWATATSPAQATTGVPAARPVCAAASAVTSPITSVQGYAGGG